jgi:hypothetical protein
MAFSKLTARAAWPAAFFFASSALAQSTLQEVVVSASRT